MAKCITKSLINIQKFDVYDVAKNYVKWFDTGDLRGIGMTCERALLCLKQGMSPLESGFKRKGRAKPSFKRIGTAPEESLTLAGDYCGNGTVMRCAPIGLFFRNNLKELERAAKEDANITHNHPDARDASYALCYMVACLEMVKIKLLLLKIRCN